MKVGVQHRHDRAVAHRAQFGDGVAHLLHRLAGVDGDHTIGCLDERLVRQTVAHQRVHPGTHRVQTSLENTTLFDVIPMCHLTTLERHRGG